MQMFKEKSSFLCIQAPMVRYSRLPFRLLCQRHGTDVSYTPMIMSSSFWQSEEARLNDFSTNYEEFGNPLVVQFAANNALDFALAARYVLPYCDAVDLNCGCPQRWAIEENIGAQLLQSKENIDLIVDILKTYRNCASDNDLVPVSVKIRKLDTEQKTIDLVRKLENTGLCSWISVHGRTIRDKSSSVPVDVNMIKLIKQNLSIPVVFNGDVFNWSDAIKFASETGADGIMSARGLLTNPALFSKKGQEQNEKQLRLECIRDFIDIVTQCADYSISFPHVHRHIMFMLNGYENEAKSILSSSDTCSFAEISSIAGIIDFLSERNLI
jgi:tRNA-dihydrouridine synthase 4